jgi:hypothetical protein
MELHPAADDRLVIMIMFVSWIAVGPVLRRGRLAVPRRSTTRELNAGSAARHAVQLGDELQRVAAPAARSVTNVRPAALRGSTNGPL